MFVTVTGTSFDPYAAPEIRHAVVKVPDARLSHLQSLYNPKKVVHATIEFMDVPGCSLDDVSGQEQWRRLLPDVRQADLLLVVVRDFENASVPMFRNRIDGRADLDVVWEELIFADLDAVTTRVDRLEKALKRPTKTHDQEKRELAVLLRCHEALEANKPLSTVLSNIDDRRLVASFAFLTEKPFVSVRNVSDDNLHAADAWNVEYLSDQVALSAAIEAEIAALEEEDRQAFLDELDLKDPARDRLIRVCYQACGLVSFLTVGSDEVRAWTISKGASAVEAAGKIHTDFAKGFIRAETVAYDDLVAHTDFKGAKAAGKVRKEGKTYCVADGDILNILSSA